MVSVIVTCCATKLSGDGSIFQTTQLFLQTPDINHNLLTQTCGWGGLSVGLCQHGHILPLLSIVIELLDEFLNHWIVHLLQSFLDAQRNAGVVDILWSQSKVDELLGLYRETAESTVGAVFASGIYLLLDEILHSFYVVVGHFFDILHALGILLSEVTIDVAQGLKEVAVYCCQLRQRQFAKGNEILDFYAHTIAYQCILGKVSWQRFGFASVTAIDRRNGGQCI